MRLAVSKKCPAAERSRTAPPDGVQRPAQVDVAEWNFDEPAVPQLACDRELADHRRIATRADQDFDCRVGVELNGGRGHRLTHGHVQRVTGAGAVLAGSQLHRGQLVA